MFELAGLAGFLTTNTRGIILVMNTPDYHFTETTQEMLPIGE